MTSSTAMQIPGYVVGTWDIDAVALDRRLLRPPHDGEQGPRLLPRLHRRDRHRGGPARTRSSPRPSTWARSTPGRSSATRTSAPPTSSTSRTTRHDLPLDRRPLRGRPRLAGRRRADHQGQRPRRSPWSSSSTASAPTPTAARAPASRRRPRSPARDFGVDISDADGRRRRRRRRQDLRRARDRGRAPHRLIADRPRRPRASPGASSVPGRRTQATPRPPRGNLAGRRCDCGGVGWTGAPLAPWLMTAARLLVGAVLVVAGALKLPDPAAAERAVRAYRLLPEALVARGGLRAAGRRDRRGARAAGRRLRADGGVAVAAACSPSTSPRSPRSGPAGCRSTAAASATAARSPPGRPPTPPRSPGTSGCCSWRWRWRAGPARGWRSAGPADVPGGRRWPRAR